MRLKRIYIDSETCGLHSIMVLLQYAVEDGPIVLWDVWKKPVGETLDVIEWIADHCVIGFNLAFDWFHIAKVFTIWSLLPRDWIPEEHIAEIAMLEKQAQDGPCLKPRSALDLLLHSRKGPYQSLMARDDIRLRRIPTVLAHALAEELETRIEIDDIYFARSHDKDAPRWQVFDIRDKYGDIDPNFKDVVLRFNPAGGLKFLAEHALGKKPKYHYKDVEPNPEWRPKELGFAPAAISISSPEQNWEVWKEKDGKRTLAGYAWPAVIEKHIHHWATRYDARDYASDDIVYTRELASHFAMLAGVDVLPDGDDDSVLACMVAVIRWRGFKLNVDGVRKLLVKAQEVVATSPVNVNRPKEVRDYLMQCLDTTEAETIELSTRKRNIEKIAGYEVKLSDVIQEFNGEEEEDETNPELQILDQWKLKHPEHCMKCDGKGSHSGGHCQRCEGRGYMVCGDHPAAVRAKVVLTVKTAVKEVELYKKLIVAGKFHASFNVIGTLSSRMSGGDGLNAQGIKDTFDVRSCFPLAWDGYLLCGGDFDSFEVTLADAVYSDPSLRKALTERVPCHVCNETKVCCDKKCRACGGMKSHACDECEGTGKATKKLHGLFAAELYECSYIEAVNDKIKYKNGKSGVFAMTYGGTPETLNRNLNIPIEIARAAYENWGRRFPGIGKSRKRIEKAFAALTQPGGIGTAIYWHEPQDEVVSFLGFPRRFTLEYKVLRALYHLARNLPKNWRDEKIKVVRSTRDARLQTAAGAVSSALYGAAFGIQGAIIRAAANHEIQSPGAQITKAVQRRIWDLQPCGVNQWRVAPMNIHDELMVVTHPSMVKAVTDTVRTVVESFRPQVPLIGMTWFEDLESWADKKSGDQAVKIRSPLMKAA